MQDAPTPQERPKLSIRKNVQENEAEYAGNTPVHRPIRKQESSNQAFAIVVAIILSVVVCGGGYFGFKHLHNQVQRISQIEAEKRDSERESEAQLDKMRTLESKLQQAEYNAKSEQEIAKRQYIEKLKYENEANLKIIRNQIESFKNSTSEQELQNIKVAEQKRIAAEKILNGLKEKQAKIQLKYETLTKENREMKAWLNIHNSTLHPRY